MKCFVVGGAEVAERGVPAGGVEERLDPLEHRRRELRPTVSDVAVQEFALHGRAEALDERVVNAGRDSAHRSEQACLVEPVSEEPAGVLRSSVGVDPGSGLGTAPPPGHLKRVDDDLRGDAIADRPADDTARVGVDHGGAADPSVSRAVLRDVTEPVRRVCAELPLLREIALVREVHNDDVELLTEAVGAANPLLGTLREACPRDWRR